MKHKGKEMKDKKKDLLDYLYEAGEDDQFIDELNKRAKKVKK